MKKKSLATVLVFLGFIGGISLLTFTQKDREFSENENRYLAKMPSISWESIKKGEFQDGFEEYIKDQIVFRDHWITVETAIQKACFNTDIGGAYVGKNGYDFEKITPDDVDQKQVNKNVKSLNNFFDYACEKVGEDNLYFILVPTSGLINSEKLPKNAILFDQNACMDNIIGQIGSHITYDVRELFKQQKDTQLYYKTDHHWTTEAARLTYNYWSERTGKDSTANSDSELVTVTESFRGSLYSKILDYDSAYDQIKVLKNTLDTEYTVIADGKDIGGIYQKDKLSEKDKYAYFMGGNYGEALIHNEAAKGKGNLLLIKDSFANSFVPMLAADYENIYMIDLRYFAGHVPTYMKENNISEIMVLYNISNFISDKNIFKIGKNLGG